MNFNTTLLILLAGILDALDGRVARLINGTLNLFKIDSLTDFVSFGIAPA